MVEVPVTMNEMLLRGCMLKNSGFITGLVVYTGKETRIQMNAAKTPLKVGASRQEHAALGCRASASIAMLHLLASWEHVPLVPLQCLVAERGPIHGPAPA